jgi:8-oxo-dGTP pyrophosphatase MutT (NUDIX family)
LHRKPLLDLLARYRAAYPDEVVCADRIRALVETQRECFERSCLPGHVTASAWVLSPDGKRFLLTHHRKLHRWLQLGGHADGDADVAAVALREAREESGLAELRFAWAADAPVPIDLDVSDSARQRRRTPSRRALRAELRPADDVERRIDRSR